MQAAHCGIAAARSSNGAMRPHGKVAHQFRQSRGGDARASDSEAHTTLHLKRGPGQYYQISVAYVQHTVMHVYNKATLDSVDLVSY